MVKAEQIPDHDQIVEILKRDGAPPHIVLDIGGSADLNGDGLVKVKLVDDELVFEDA